ncbi:YlmC/YmxH family sporulation protein [Clostridium sp. MSJ-11]|uniref:YlmC/YmxH family sporulation protein n=1 Tax=Clostridium mobile TaxID=2841512 RepID=A0ABS6EI98_9CLOT|nr:YlmC/YmxH family sporulation protein [Clostridium mobile]MBU5484964.1 YlmC/YmxH family sporulation protein [Clostridium mobile]
MELTYHSINNIRTMEIIDINSGAKLGYMRDFKIDVINSKIISIIIPSQKISWFGKNNDIEIPWEKIKKIGVDVILVDGEEYFIDKP